MVPKSRKACDLEWRKLALVAFVLRRFQSFYLKSMSWKRDWIRRIASQPCILTLHQRLQKCPQNKHKCFKLQIKSTDPGSILDRLKVPCDLQRDTADMQQLQNGLKGRFVFPQCSWCVNTGTWLACSGGSTAWSLGWIVVSFVPNGPTIAAPRSLSTWCRSSDLIDRNLAILCSSCLLLNNLYRAFAVFLLTDMWPALQTCAQGLTYRNDTTGSNFKGVKGTLQYFCGWHFLSGKKITWNLAIK